MVTIMIDANTIKEAIDKNIRTRKDIPLKGLSIIIELVVFLSDFFVQLVPHHN